MTVMECMMFSFFLHKKEKKKLRFLFTLIEGFPGSGSGSGGGGSEARHVKN